jgi:hypothetical protein
MTSFGLPRVKRLITFQTLDISFFRCEEERENLPCPV